MELKIRYAGAADSLKVQWVHTWLPGEIERQTMSQSGGPKDEMRNWIYDLFAKDREIEKATLVVGHRTPFVIVRKKGRWYDASKREVEVVTVQERSKT